MSEQAKNRKLFGTDGVRSAAGEPPLDRESVIRLGYVLGRKFPGARIAAGRDTRESGPVLLSQLAKGIGDSAQLIDCGILPTPGLSYIVEHGPFDYGVMITASHNPWTDNGVKIFNRDGEKLPDELEAELETMFFSFASAGKPDGEYLSSALPSPASNSFFNEEDPRKMYLEDLGVFADEVAEAAPPGFKVILDCAEGAVYQTAPEVFHRSGMLVETIHDAPDGKNINRNCGSTHLKTLIDAMRRRDADLGIAFDGDGDRVLMTDRFGRVLDGDHTLFAVARYLKSIGKIGEKWGKADVIVGTVMSNFGLERALTDMNIRFVRTDVGDRHVYAAMKEYNAPVGGEPSGHTILSAYRRSGDGVLTALYFLKALFHLKLTPGELYDMLPLFPQRMESFVLKKRRPLEQWPELQQLERVFKDTYGDRARTLIRYSGTEPKIRIMLEASEQEIIDRNFPLFESLIKSSPG